VNPPSRVQVNKMKLCVFIISARCGPSVFGIRVVEIAPETTSLSCISRRISRDSLFTLKQILICRLCVL